MLRKAVHLFTSAMSSSKETQLEVVVEVLVVGLPSSVLLSTISRNRQSPDISTNLSLERSLLGYSSIQVQFVSAKVSDTGLRSDFEKKS